MYKYKYGKLSQVENENSLICCYQEAFCIRFDVLGVVIIACPFWILEGEFTNKGYFLPPILTVVGRQEIFSAKEIA